MRFDFNLFVIGGGSGGVRAARVAAGELGIKVGLAEEDRYGGTCVIRGCVPKKLMVYASEYSQMPSQAKAYGWHMDNVRFDWSKLRGNLHAELDRLEEVYRRLLSGAGVTSFDARARIVDPHCVELADGTRITAEHILVATGGRPFLPDIPGIEHAISSNEMFLLKTLPKRILIVGGGYIACEFAGIMNGLRVATTQFYRGEQILRGFDDEACNHLAAQMLLRGVDLRLNINVVSIEKTEKGLLVTDSNGETAAFDQVMFATGRRANSDALGLETLGVRQKPNGAIEVDAYSQSSVPSIYAIGDVTDRVNLTPVAIREAMAFTSTLFQGQPVAVDHDLIASAVFTQPELGTIGQSEAEARAKGPVDIYTTQFKPMRQGFVQEDEKTFMKLVVDQVSQKVLGCHIIAPGAGEMIQMVAIAIKMGATKADFDQAVAVHPTLAEELVTMRHPSRGG